MGKMVPVYNFLASNVMAPALDFVRGTRTMKCLRELEESQWWSRDRILELQNERLKRLIQHAYNNVPYYRRLFDERGLTPNDMQSAKGLVRLPVLTKSEVRNCFKDLTACNIPEKQRVSLITGGSTGKPLHFYRSRQDQLSWSYAAAERSLSWAGYRLGDKLIRLSALRPYCSIKEKFSETSKRFFKRVMQLDPRDISLETLPQYAAKMEGFRPEFIWGAPSAVELVAQFMKKSGHSNLNLKGVITGAEQLYDRQRQLFTSVFGCQTYSIYSSWEAHAIGGECSYHSGFHISAENVIVEIVDGRGNPVQEGQEGVILITNLHNYAMPFIRYNLEDQGVFTSKSCLCGRGLPLIGKLSGRNVDVIRTRSGKTITGTALVHLFMNPPGVIQFQFFQISYDELVVKLVMDRQYPVSHLEKVSSEIKKKYLPVLGPGLNIKVEFVDQIPATESGKRMAVISQLNLLS